MRHAVCVAESLVGLSRYLLDVLELVLFCFGNLLLEALTLLANLISLAD